MKELIILIPLKLAYSSYIWGHVVETVVCWEDPGGSTLVYIPLLVNRSSRWWLNKFNSTRLQEDSEIRLIGMGNTCKPMAVSFQCMTKFTTNKKNKQKKKRKKKKDHFYRKYVSYQLSLMGQKFLLGKNIDWESAVKYNQPTNWEMYISSPVAHSVGTYLRSTNQYYLQRGRDNT